jgi:hypothetical protein
MHVRQSDFLFFSVGFSNEMPRNTPIDVIISFTSNDITQIKGMKKEAQKNVLFQKASIFSVAQNVCMPNYTR